MKRILACNKGWLLILVAVLVFAGCAAKTGEEAEAVKKEEGPAPVYLDFGDVMVPPDLKLDKNASFIYQTAGFGAGVMVLSGRPPVEELVRFFETNMVKDNWTLVSAFKSPRSMMLFKKENRRAVINITNGAINNDIEIWVAPTMVETDTDQGLLK